VHSLLQASPRLAAVSLARFIGNTTFGLAGFFDPMEVWGLPASREDFGQTFGVWGIPPGPYLVLPLLGPSDIRDAAGSGLDSLTTVHTYFVPFLYTQAMFGTRVINDRSQALDSVQRIKEASVDYYSAVRNGYLQLRQAQIENRRGSATTTDETLYKIDDEE
jgi:phospholipid-binding lipoprotein MlaA